MKILDVTGIIMRINSIIDSRKHDDISVECIRREIGDGCVFNFIKKETGFNLSMFELTDDVRTAYKDELLNIFESYAGDERKKWGVSNSGLCLLLAWTNEILQIHCAEREINM